MYQLIRFFCFWTDNTPGRTDLCYVLLSLPKFSLSHFHVCLEPYLSFCELRTQRARRCMDWRLHHTVSRTRETRFRMTGRTKTLFQSLIFSFFLDLSLDQTHREGHKRGEAVVLPPTLNRHHPEKELSSMLATIDIDIVEQSWMGWAEFNGIVTWECFILHPWTPTFSNVGSFSWNQFYHVFSHFINSAPYSSSPAATQSTT